MTIEADVHYHGICNSDTCGGAERITNTVNDGHDGRPDTGAPRCLDCGSDLQSVEKHNPETPEDQAARGVGTGEASGAGNPPTKIIAGEPAIDAETKEPQEGPYRTTQFEPPVEVPATDTSTTGTTGEPVRDESNVHPTPTEPTPEEQPAAVPTSKSKTKEQTS